MLLEGELKIQWGIFLQVKLLFEMDILTIHCIVQPFKEAFELYYLLTPEGMNIMPFYRKAN